MPHTPGPWNCMEIDTPDSHRIEVFSDLGYVAQVDFIVEGNAQARKRYEANAALIAAAPELYAACVRAIASDQTSDMVRVSILSAIAKAEGRE